MQTEKDFKNKAHTTDYDQKKTLDYMGTVEEFKFENPHASARVKNKNKTWLVILAPTSRMESRGVPVDKIVKGSQLRVVGYPHKTVKDEMNDLFIVYAKPLFHIFVYINDLYPFLRILAIYHHLIFHPQFFLNYRFKTFIKHWLEHNKLIGRNTSLYNHLTQAIRAIDHHSFFEAAFRIK
jgi:hypothetical protein